MKEEGGGGNGWWTVDSGRFSAMQFPRFSLGL